MVLSENKTKIKNFFAHSVTGKSDDSFVGFKIMGNEIHFYYPESYRFDPASSTMRNDIVDLLRTVSIAKTKSTTFSQANNTYEGNGEFALISYLWVINDFLSNGFYVNREKTYKINQSGKVNWKRTMQSQPIVSNGNVIYPNITVEVKNNIDNVMVDIHKHCVKVSIDFIGWLFNLSSNFIEDKPYNETIKKIYIAALRQELDSTFEDEKRLRLNHFLNVILGLDSKNNNEFVYGVDSYYYVFERMIDSIFGNIKNIREFNPKAKWQLVKNNYRETKSSDLRPDTIIVKENEAFIIDSKFYRFGFTGKEEDLPETTSIQKQITYGEFIEKNVAAVNIENVYNAFLLPYDKSREVFKSDENIQYIGFAKTTWKDNTKKHELVHSFLIDLKHVVKTWNRYSHETDVNYLISEIVKKQEEAQIKLQNTFPLQ